MSKKKAMPMPKKGVLKRILKLLFTEYRLAMIAVTVCIVIASAASTIASCDYCAKIPMAHGVDSLNVAAAGAVAFWQLRWRK